MIDSKDVHEAHDLLEAIEKLNVLLDLSDKSLNFGSKDTVTITFNRNSTSRSRTFSDDHSVKFIRYSLKELKNKIKSVLHELGVNLSDGE